MSQRSARPAWPALSFVLLALLALVPVVAAAADASQDPLERVESLLASGRLTEARNTLERWISENPPGSRGASSDQQAHALLLKGRLTADVREAEDAYLAVVLSYPTSRRAPEALLRLGQVLVAIGMADGDAEEAARGASYLQRLLDDHPGSPQQPLAMLWLARAHQVAGAHDDACDVARRGAEAGAEDPTLDTLLREERETACTAARVGPPASPPYVSPAGEQRQSDTDRARFAVQSTAVRNRDSAESLAARLRRAGFEPRVVQIDGSSLFRVRVGRYTSSAEATAVARRVRQTGFEAVVVTDAHRERR